MVKKRTGKVEYDYFEICIIADIFKMFLYLTFKSNSSQILYFTFLVNPSSWLFCKQKLILAFSYYYVFVLDVEGCIS